MAENAPSLINATATHIPLPDKSVHCIVTSPPYHSLRKYHGKQTTWWPGGEYHPFQHLSTTISVPEMTCDYGREPTITAYDWHTLLILREQRRVLRDDGVLWWVVGDNYDGGNLSGMPYRILFAAQADGWIIRNDVVWKKKNPMPDPVNGWRYETDPCSCVTERREAAIAKAISVEGVERHRTYHLSGNKFEPDSDCPRCGGTGYCGDLKLRSGSWRHTRAHETVLMLTKQMGYWSDREAVKEPLAHPDRGADGRYFGGNNKHAGYGNPTYSGRLYIPSDGKNPRDTRDTSLEQQLWSYVAETHPEIIRDFLGLPEESIDIVEPKASPYSGKHFAVFPPALIEPLIKATCPKYACPQCGTGWSPVVRRGEVVTEYRPSCGCGRADSVPGTVFDPFNGSGTTLLVAKQLGMRGIGADISLDYLINEASTRLGLRNLPAPRTSASQNASLFNL